jgi:hypothetical protein
MKLKLVLLSTLLGVTTQGLATTKPIIEKTNASGFTMPEYVRTETCQVYPTYVKITNRYGGFADQSVETTQILWVSVSEDVETILAKATEDSLIESGNYICDAPSTTITANYNGDEFTLFSSGGCGSKRQERQGGFAQILKDIVNRYCPVTHDFGAQEPTFLPDHDEN